MTANKGHVSWVPTDTTKVIRRSSVPVVEPHVLPLTPYYIWPLQRRIMDQNNLGCGHCAHTLKKHINIQSILEKWHKILTNKDFEILVLTKEVGALRRQTQKSGETIAKLQDENVSLREEKEDLFRKLTEARNEILDMKLEQEKVPERPPLPIPIPPPPPPPPAMRVLAKLMPWRSAKYQRSKSMSRIDDMRNRRDQSMMILNEDILEAIKNRRYSLKHVQAPEEDAKERLRAKKTHFLSEGGCPANSDHGAIMARILERRINMAYDNEDENGSSESDNASTATFDSDDQANELDHATKANNPHPYISQ